jgi:hypothetical protein
MWWLAAGQAGMSYLEARKQQDVEYAASKIREMEGEAKIQAIGSERERLAKDQRKIKATQRMSVASRGGLMGGTDLLTLTEEAKQMQLDQLEMVRQQDIERVRMQNEAAMRDYQKNYTKNMLKNTFSTVWTPFGKFERGEGYTGF